jgi:hypothetical protein
MQLQPEPAPCVLPVDARESTQGRAVEQRFLERIVGQVEPVLHEVHAQHALQPYWRATIAWLRVMRFDHFTQFLPRQELVCRRKERVALGGGTVSLESGPFTAAAARVCCFVAL